MKAQVKSSIEVYNIDDALAVFDNNQFKLILAAATRSREIATQRTFQERNGVKITYENKSIFIDRRLQDWPSPTIP